MEIILTQDIPTLGYKGDIVAVKPGYARNYLIPQKLAVTASVSNRKIVAENQKQAAHKVEQIKNEALALANQLSILNLQIKAKTGTSGRIFGSITHNQVSNALKERGIEVDRRRISFPTEMKELGTYEIVIDLHREVKAKLNLELIAE